MTLPFHRFRDNFKWPYFIVLFFAKTMWCTQAVKIHSKNDIVPLYIFLHRFRERRYSALAFSDFWAEDPVLVRTVGTVSSSLVDAIFGSQFRSFSSIPSSISFVSDCRSTPESVRLGGWHELVSSCLLPSLGFSVSFPHFLIFLDMPLELPLKVVSFAVRITFEICTFSLTRTSFALCNFYHKNCYWTSVRTVFE